MALWKAYVDGSALNQGTDRPLQAGLGVVITRNDKVVWGFARGLGSVTNNIAEYEAVLAALLMCWSAGDIYDPIIHSDSQVVVNQVNGIWQCRSKSLLPRLFSIQQIQAQYRFRLIQVPRHVVSAADQLVKDFLRDLIDTYPDLTHKELLPTDKLRPPPI